MLILPSHYLPCIEWFRQFLAAEDSIIDVHEHFVKQTYRNRTHILSANGKLALTIPVKKMANHTPMVDVKIENDFTWQHQHWLSIKSAYGSAPYFMYYQDYFELMYSTKYSSLVDWNADLLKICLKIMKVNKQLVFSENYQITKPTDLDVRNKLNPKKESGFTSKPYLQVFSEKFPFEPNLGILDVLFNQGPRWKELMI